MTISYTYLFSSFIIHYQLFWSGIFLGVLLKFLSSFTYFLKNLYWTRSLIIIIDRFCTFFFCKHHIILITIYVLIIVGETVTPVTSLLNLLWQRRAFFSLLLFVKYFVLLCMVKYWKTVWFRHLILRILFVCYSRHIIKVLIGYSPFIRTHFYYIVLIYQNDNELFLFTSPCL